MIVNCNTKALLRKLLRAMSDMNVSVCRLFKSTSLLHGYSHLCLLYPDLLKKVLL